MASGIRALDEPAPLRPASRILGGVSIAAYAGITAAVAWHADVPGPVLPATAIAHSVAMFAVTGFTSLLLLAYARSSGRRGFLVLGGSYAFVCLCLAVFPLLFPNGVLVTEPPQPLIGGSQSSVTMFWIWHWVFLAGIVAAALVFVRDRGRSQPTHRGGLGITLAAVTAAFALAVAAVTLAADRLPVLIDLDRATDLQAWPTHAFIVATCAATVVVAWTTVRGAVINRWLLAVTLVLTGEAFVVVSADRYSLGWYFNRAFGFLALSVLLVVLLWNLGRIGRTTNELAARDQLTGAQSRASFMADMDFALVHSRRTGADVALLWLDLDGFKEINDELGHLIGDDILRQVVAQVRACLSAGDRVGRLGGDEFGILLTEDVTDGRIGGIADAILAGVRAPITAQDATTLLTASIGVSVSPTDACGPEELLLASDLAMYAAKKSGGDRWQRFDSSLESQALTRARLRQNLSAAIRRESFDLVYQPIIHTDSHEVAGVEALVRWVRDGRRVEAKEFVEFAESSGQVLAIGRSVIRVLERDLPQIFARVSADVFVSFNMSVRELADDGLVAQLLRSSLPRWSPRVVVEVTESVELDEASQAARNLARLRAAGMPIAVDDFGTGYSNLLRLAQLQPTLLKLDRGLIAPGAGQEGVGPAFLAAANGVARSLQCDVIAEGVETPHELAVVTDLGIKYSQGYLYAVPMPLAELLDLLAAPARLAPALG